MSHSEYYIIDSHAHIFPDKIAEKATQATGLFYDIEMDNVGSVSRLLESGSKINVNKYVVHSTATKPEQVSSINEYISNECKKNPEFIGFGTMHPFLTLDEQKKELDRFEKLGLIGVKLHPDIQEFSLDSEDSLRMFKLFAGRYPVLIHMGDARYQYSNPHRLAAVLKKYPKLDVIGAHLGGYSEWNEVKKHLIGMNVYFDTSSSICMMEKQEAIDIITSHGMDKIVWGTDFPMWKHENEFNNLINLGFTHEENQKIFSENLLKLLSKYGYKKEL